MDACVDRTDLHCEEIFARPAFSRIGSFPQIIEPVYDAFDAAGFRIPADAMRIENGDSIATAKVSLSLRSGLHAFEARLDGFEAHFLDLKSPDAVEQAVQLARLFGDTVVVFLQDGEPSRTVIRTSRWLTVDGGYEAADSVVRSVALIHESDDPFRIGAHTMASQMTFACTNQDANWTAFVTVAGSQLPNTHLFLQVASEYAHGSYAHGSKPGHFIDRTRHVEEIWSSVAVSLGLAVS